VRSLALSRRAFAGILVLIATLAAAPLSAQEAPRRSIDYDGFAERVLRPPPADPAFARNVATEVVRLTNVERRKMGLRAVDADEELVRPATAHAADMLRRRYFAHETPEGLAPQDRIAGTARRGVLAGTAENLYMAEGPWRTQLTDIAREAVVGWMNSPGHRANILRASMTHLGVGIAANDDRIYVVQNFADVRARLSDPVPARLRQGDVIRVQLAPGSTGGFNAVALLRADAEGPVTKRPGPLGQISVDVPAGLWRVALYRSVGPQRFEISMGPLVQVE
jgi:uncharacterized protein YkwD